MDAFRGLAIAMMVLVNNPGSYSYVYHPLRQSDWQGCTPADFVFPFFLIIVGISIAFSLAARLQKKHRGTFSIMKSIFIKI